MKNNPTYLIIILSLLTLTLQGCLFNSIIGPGYWVSIEVTDSDFKRENMTQFEEIAILEQFNKMKTAEEANWYCDYYHNNSSEKYKSLEIMMSYDKKENELRISVLDIWAGQQIKTDIDRIASIYIDVLSKKYGENKVRIVRQRTGPGI